MPNYVTNFDIENGSGTVENVLVRDSDAQNKINTINSNISSINNNINTINSNINTINRNIANNQDSINQLWNSAYNFRRTIILGDSYTVGYTPSGNVKSWANIFSENYTHDELDIIAESGVGFSHESTSTNRTFLGMWNARASTIAELDQTTAVLIMGGVNDRNDASTNVQSGVRSLLYKIFNDCPNAHVFLIPSPTCYFYNYSVLSTIINAVISLRLTILPTQYSMVGHPELFANDNVHPNEDGQTKIYEIINSMLHGQFTKNHWYLTGLGLEDYTAVINGIDNMCSIYVSGRTANARTTRVFNIPDYLSDGDMRNYYCPMVLDSESTQSKNVGALAMSSTAKAFFIVQDPSDLGTRSFQGWVTIDAQTCFGSN